MATDKVLRRSQSERMLAGVCGGLGDYFELDPILFRLVFVVLTLTGIAPGMLAYLILWIVMPEEDVEEKL